MNSSTQISGNPTEFFGILVFPAVEKFYLFPKSGFCGKSGHIPVPIPGISALKKYELPTMPLVLSGEKVNAVRLIRGNITRFSISMC
jgi:hypothetical protein